MSKSLINDSSCKTKCPCNPLCPLQYALSLIGGKWKIPILCALNQDGDTRYNELKKKIGKITDTMLASSLKELEQDGLILRTQYMEMPVRVEYRITDTGKELVPILEQLAQWGLHSRERGQK